MSHKKWVVKSFDKELAAEISEEFNIDPFLALLLITRGVVNYEDVDEFLTCELDLSDPYEIIDMDKAVDRINFALDNNEKIAVYGDFDADGVTATALLYSYLKSKNANVIYYIPQRESEGYGLNCDAIDQLAKENVNLIITVDNGISAINEADYISELGIDLIVTDHHQPTGVLPKAVAVVDPHRADCQVPFKDWAGVGVAFKLVSAVHSGDIDDLIVKYADLVAIGTVADIVPLIGENRSLVKFGLNVINLNERVGMNGFRRALNIMDKEFTATDLAFIVAPRINAAGRMDDAKLAAELLIENDLTNAERIASILIEHNVNRQNFEKEIINDIEKQIENNTNLFNSRVIVVEGENYHPGVIGIVASKIVDKYGKPCVVISNDENGVSRGSCRSVDGFSIYDALTFCKDELIRFGGHPMAAGLSLKTEDVDNFRNKINQYAFENYQIMPEKQLEIDCKISPVYITIELINSISMLEPYGCMNTQPVFALMNMKLVAVTPVGEGKHIRLTVQKGGKNFNVICFGVSQEEFAYNIGENLDIAVHISKNDYNGKVYVSIQAVDVRLSGSDDEKYVLEKAVYTKYKLNENLSESDYNNLIPNREVCVKVYRYLLSCNGFKYGFDSLYFRLQSGVTYGQLLISLNAFSQLGLITINNEVISINQTASKVDLESAEILIELKSRLSNG